MTRASIHRGDLEIEIDTLGARIMSFTNSGQEIMKTAKDELQGYNGMVLAPWPNRIPEGRYSLGDKEYQLEVNELDRNNALHGFAFQTEFEIIFQEQDQITLTATLHKETGYPFEIQLQITYSLKSSGFSCEVKATNKSIVPAPFGIAFHPYYPVDDETQISIPAKTHITTNDQMIPIGEQPNRHKSFRFADVDLDDCFNELGRTRGIAELLIQHSDRQIALWQDEAFDYVMVYTTNEFDALQGSTQAIAIEAQSCLANAFNTEPPLLKPGESFTGSWGLTSSV